MHLGLNYHDRKQTNNDGRAKVLGGKGHRVFPMRGYPRWILLNPSMDQDDPPVSDRNRRKSLASSLKLEASFRDIDRSRISNHSLRSGGSSVMFDGCFEIEITKRWRCEPPLSTPIFGVMSTSRPISVEACRIARFIAKLGRGRTRATCHGPTSRVRGNIKSYLRSTTAPKTQRHGRRRISAIKTVCDLPRLFGFRTTVGGLRLIVNGK